MAHAALDAIVSLLLPAKNEAENLPYVLEEAERELPRFFRDYEIIVVDDGSTDATADVVREAAARNPRIHLVQHAVNRGYGDAVRSAIRAAGGDFLFLLDSDHQFRLADLEQLIAALPGHDGVVGYRAKRQDPAHRRFYAGVFNRVVRLLFGVRVRDIDCAFKLLPAAPLKGADLRARYALVSTELHATLARHGSKIAEVPVRHFPRTRGHQTGGSLKVMVRSLPQLAALWWRHVRMP